MSPKSGYWVQIAWPNLLSCLNSHSLMACQFQHEDSSNLISIVSVGHHMTIYRQNLALNDLQRLICHKTQPTNQLELFSLTVLHYRTFSLLHSLVQKKKGNKHVANHLNSILLLITQSQHKLYTILPKYCKTFDPLKYFFKCLPWPQIFSLRWILNLGNK